MTELKPNIVAIFSEAIALTCAHERCKYLDQVCQDDASTRERIESLLLAHFQELKFLGGPPPTSELLCDGLLGTHIGPYKLREQIGEGGMGVVFVAEQIEPVKRKVALKVIKRGTTCRDVIARFEGERQALALMDHPNIAKVHDAGATDSGQPYFVMELVQGPSITTYCDQQRLDMKQRLELFLSVCRAVNHAHQKGIIHRDLKPSNILVPEIDGTPVSKVIDFGIAKAVDQKLTEQTIYTQFSQLVGTPLYMSPEQAGLGVVDVDTRSDVYSLGVLLYELLTGSTPFGSHLLKEVGFDEMRRIVREDEPQRPSTRVSTLAAEPQSTVAERRQSGVRTVVESLKGEIDWIVMTALEKDRNRRYQSASNLADDIERHLRSEPIEARPVSHWYRVKRFVRRNRALVASSAAVVLALVAGLALATAGLSHALEQRDLAKQAEKDARIAEQIAEQRAKELVTVVKDKESAIEDQQVLNDVLSDMYPRPFLLVSPGKNRTVYDSVEELGEQVNDGRLSGHPRVEIDVRIIFADAYFAAGEYDKFRKHLEVALTLAKQEYGEPNAKVAGIHQRLAYEVAANGGIMDRNRTLRHADEAIRIQKLLGAESVHAWAGRAYSLMVWPERHAEAIAAAKRAIELDGEYPVFTYVDLGNLYRRFHNAEHLDQALACFTKAQENYEKSGGSEAQIRATLLAHVAKCQRYRGDLVASVDNYQAAHDLYQTVNLRGEPNGLAVGVELADLLIAKGDVDEAYRLITEVEANAREFDVTSSSVHSSDLKGWLYFQLGDYQQAVVHFEQAKQLARVEYGEMDGRFGLSCLHLALAYEAMGQRKDAADHYRQLQPITQYLVDAPLVHGTGYWVHARGLLVTHADHQTLPNEVDRIVDEGHRQVQSWRQASQEPAFHLLKALIQRRRRKSPEVLAAAINELQIGLQKAFEPNATVLNIRGHQVPTDRRQVEEQLVDFLVQAGRTDEARNVLKNGVTIRSKVNSLGPDHIQTILAEIRLAEFLHRHEMHDEVAVERLKAIMDKLQEYSSVVDAVRQRVAALLQTYDG